MRKYKHKEEIGVGDVVCYFTDKELPFPTCIVERIDGNEALLVRPMARVANGAIPMAWLNCERFMVDLGALYECYLVYTTGPSGNKYTMTF